MTLESVSHSSRSSVHIILLAIASYSLHVQLIAASKQKASSSNRYRLSQYLGLKEKAIVRKSPTNKPDHAAVRQLTYLT